MSDSVEEIFSSLESSFKAGVLRERHSFYFSIDDHKWTVVVDSESCSVERGKTVENADCFVKTSEEMFLKIYNGHHYPGVGDFLSGRIKSNNPYMMKTFVEVFSG